MKNSLCYHNYFLTLQKWLIIIGLGAMLCITQQVNAANNNNVPSNSLILDFTIASKHFCDCPAITNERNFGFGVSYKFTERFEIKGGFFRNSYSKNSNYLVLNYNPFVAESENFSLAFGIGAALVSGYEDTPAQNGFKLGTLRAGLIPNLSLTYKPLGTRVSLFTPGPSVIALQVGFSLK